VSDYNLTPAEIDVLTFIVNNKDKKITAKDISMHRGVTKGLISKAVNILVEKNLIITKVNKEDARSFYLSLKDYDNEIVKVIEKANNRFIELLLLDISSDEVESFLRINRKMLDNIKELE
ncbi:MAG TPA: helix-turn-helix domain-containing protein, partial [Tissierellaceae bacterium]